MCALGFNSLGRLLAQRAPRPKAMSEKHGRADLWPREGCDERYSEGPGPASAAGPERADEGGGPTPGRLGGNNVLRNHSETLPRPGEISCAPRDPPLILHSWRRLAIAGPVCAGVASAAANWQRWIDPFVDSAREMIVPARLADGERLYRDVVYHYGPAGPWINAVVIRIFGRRFAALEAVGLLASILLFCSLARLTARAGSRLSAFLAATWGAAVCLGAPAGGSFLFPYSFGTLIALAAAFLCLDQASDARGARSDGLAAGGLALALAAKPEIGAACVLLLLLWLLRSEERRRLSRQTFRIVGGGLGGAAVAYGIAFAGISLASLSPEGPLALFAPPREWRNVYRLLAGLGDPARAIRATGTALFCGVVLLVLAALAANIAVRAPRAALFIWTLLVGGMTLFFSLPIGGAIDDRLPPLLEPMAWPMAPRRLLTRCWPSRASLPPRRFCSSISPHGDSPPGRPWPSPGDPVWQSSWWDSRLPGSRAGIACCRRTAT